MLFKIYGERNSGTNFLCQLLDQNFGNVYGNGEGCLLMNKNKFFYYWKHDIPQKDIDADSVHTIKIFIFRKLEPWLVSMFHNPYNIRFPKPEFQCFLESKLTLSYDKIYNPDINYVYQNNKIINLEDEGKTIFDLRYHKYQKIKDFCHDRKNIVFVNLDYLQNNENCLTFLKEINKEYKLGKEYFTLVDKHTKKQQNLLVQNNKGFIVVSDIYAKNKDYKINYEDYQEIIDQHKNTEIENEINNLTYFIK